MNDGRCFLHFSKNVIPPPPPPRSSQPDTRFHQSRRTSNHFIFFALLHFPFFIVNAPIDSGLAGSLSSSPWLLPRPLTPFFERDLFFFFQVLLKNFEKQLCLLCENSSAQKKTSLKPRREHSLRRDTVRLSSPPFALSLFPALQPTRVETPAFRRQTRHR